MGITSGKQRGGIGLFISCKAPRRCEDVYMYGGRSRQVMMQSLVLVVVVLHDT